MLLDIRLVQQFSSFITEAGNKNNMGMDAGGHRVQFSGFRVTRKNMLLVRKTYFSTLESRLSRLCGYLPFNVFSPILKYIIVLIQTTALYTTLCNK